MYLGTKNNGVVEYDKDTVLRMLESKPKDDFVVVDGSTIYKGTGSEILVQLKKSSDTAEQLAPVTQQFVE